MNYKMINNLLGWLMFLVSTVVYTLTLEPSVSLWDCGEFLSAADKLQVVHPPGAPFFLLIGRMFAMMASKATSVALFVNFMSALSSGLTVLFTFWITTHFAKKIVKDDGSMGNRFAIFGSGVVAALSLTFMDSFWFSAVEAEVYAMSSFFTALTFWLALRWEESNRPDADKWLVMIAYMIGLAIGTHLLNLLVIPTVVFIYYFKKFKMSNIGMLKSLGVGLVILFFVQKGIIPGIPKLMASFDLFFVNSLGLPFNSGALFAVVLLIAGTAYGIYYFQKIKPNRNVNLGFICLAYIILGYSSYAMVVIRSMDNPAIDMNNPEEPFNLLSYINREQYGDRPLLYGPYFNAPPAYDESGNPVVVEGRTLYRKDADRYTDIGKRMDYQYDKSYSTLFPRMGDKDKGSSEQGYRSWSGMSSITDEIDYQQQKMSQAQDPKEKQEIQNAITELKMQKPKFSNNLAFLVNYQLGHMYWRYFMWNFVGRQNDQQGHDFNRLIDGNWISGIKFFDAMRLGPQTNLPAYMENNMGRNKYYFIPFILGILGLILHYKKAKGDAISTIVLFVFTGFLIIIFLNQPPYEPRERDYSLVGSFQTFCIWIGLGVLFIWDRLRNAMSSVAAGALATVVSLSAPYLMGSQGWDDHDRSQRYLGVDFAKNYLNSCPPNAILFTNGDNDTYPLWYAQNVEGVRRDVRIINQSLLPTDWYSQVLKHKVYESDALPLTMSEQQLAAGINDYFMYQDQKNFAPIDLAEFVKDLSSSGQQYYSYKKLRVKVDKKAVLAAGVVPMKDSSKIVSDIIIDFPNRSLNKGDLVLLDLIATNAATGWKRPICFSSTSGDDGFLGMEAYFVRKGLIYQLIPERSQTNRGQVNNMDADYMYDLLINKYGYSGMKEKKNFYLDDKASIVPSTIQGLFINTGYEYLAKIEEIKTRDSSLSIPENKALVDEYKKKIITLVNKCKTEIPERVLHMKADVKYNFSVLLHEAGDTKAAEAELSELFDNCLSEVNYYLKFGEKRSYYMRGQAKDAFDTMDRCVSIGNYWGAKNLTAKWEKTMKEMRTTVNNFVNTEG